MCVCVFIYVPTHGTPCCSAREGSRVRALGLLVFVGAPQAPMTRVAGGVWGCLCHVCVCVCLPMTQLHFCSRLVLGIWSSCSLACRRFSDPARCVFLKPGVLVGSVSCATRPVPAGQVHAPANMPGHQAPSCLLCSSPATGADLLILVNAAFAFAVSPRSEAEDASHRPHTHTTVTWPATQTATDKTLPSAAPAYTAPTKQKTAMSPSTSWAG